MSSYAFNYSFNITGNCDVVVQGITQGVKDLNDKIHKSVGLWDSFEGKLLALNQFTQYIEGVGRTMQETLQPGAALNASLADLSAISGETGESLRTIEGYARDTAKAFGGSAAQSVESYKLLLSQLSPELAKYPSALKAMGDNIAVLSKTMGGNATAAAEVLTTAMNQYGVSLADPMEASRQMAKMMNVMAAAGQAGSAELPTIKVALEQCGMAAKAAGVSFEETNAAIQVLDKAGKKGAEGGVALRNVMAILSTGRFLPKDVKEELTAAGVNINALTDKSKSLTDRLTPLKKVLNDTALFTKLFGRENSNAAMALVQGIDEVTRYESVITGTNTAVEQAGIIMGSYNERLSRVRAKFDDLKISLFNASGDWGIWVEVVVGSLVPLAQMTPLLLGIGKGIVFIRSLNFAGMWHGVIGVMGRAILSLQMYNGYLSIGKVQALGFMRNIMQATVATLRFATVGIWSGIKAIGAYVLSLVTGGAASVTFAGIASAGFAAFKTAAVTACRAVGVAYYEHPDHRMDCGRHRCAGCRGRLLLEYVRKVPGHVERALGLVQSRVYGYLEHGKNRVRRFGRPDRRSVQVRRQGHPGRHSENEGRVLGLRGRGRRSLHEGLRRGDRQVESGRRSQRASLVRCRNYEPNPDPQPRPAGRRTAKHRDHKRKGRQGPQYHREYREADRPLRGKHDQYARRYEPGEGIGRRGRFKRGERRKPCNVMGNLGVISFGFVAAGVAQQARFALCRFQPSQQNAKAPSWEGHGGDIAGHDLSVPITDRSYWESRYVLTELTLRREDGRTLVVNDAVVNISREKHMVRTTLVGLSGTIKEYISNGDYDISITVGIVAVRDGVIVDEYPEEGIREVREFLDENKAIEVSSVFFELFDISRIVVTRFALNQDTHSNRQTIDVKALSDEDYVIKNTDY